MGSKHIEMLMDSDTRGETVGAVRTETPLLSSKINYLLFRLNLQGFAKLLEQELKNCWETGPRRQLSTDYSSLVAVNQLAIF